MLLEQLDIKKKNLDKDIIHFKEINSKWIIDNVKLGTIKLLEDKQEKNLDDLRFGNDFLGTTPKAQSIKEIIDKLDFIKIKLLLCKRQCQENEESSHRLGEIFVKDTSGKGLLSKIYKEHLKLNSNKMNNPVKK